MPEIALEGDPAVPLDESLVVDDLADLEPLRAAFDAGTPVVVRADTPERIVAALTRPEVTCVVVPPDRSELLEIDLTKLTYG